MTTAEEVADVLDGAHDELLVRGWCKGSAEDEKGRVCSIGALRLACNGFTSLSLVRHRVGMAATEALAAQLPSQYEPDDISIWNDRKCRTIDDVLDAFRHAAKGLRNGELTVPA